MKKIVWLSLFILFYAISFSQETDTKLNKNSSEYIFAPVGAEWYYTESFSCCPENHFRHIVSERDTSINGHTCRVLSNCYDDMECEDEYIILHEDNKVYYFYNNQFNLLYDFGVEVGDTVEYVFMYKDSYANGTVKDTLFSARYIVESVIESSNETKVFRTQIVDDDVCDFYGIAVPPIEYQTYSYEERIGLDMEFMPKFGNAPEPAGQVFKFLRCYSDNNYSFVSNRWSEYSLPCNNKSTNIFNEYNNVFTNIYPNPANNLISVSVNTECTIDIFTVSGYRVLSSNLHSGTNEISIENLSAGIYYVNIQSEGKISKNIKLIKL